MHSIGSLLQWSEEIFHRLYLFDLQIAGHELWVPIVRYVLSDPYDVILMLY